ncbi:MAG: hypothetical protein E2P02_01985 [Acidobacteria bacterium]|nr:MAG: hypothetical protein E2P02_01985 [Acidobacteriota bacterium]
MIRKFDTVRDLMSLTEPIVVNCTGLGAKELFDDGELVPLKGQLTCITRGAGRSEATPRGRGGRATVSVG